MKHRLTLALVPLFIVMLTFFAAAHGASPSPVQGEAAGPTPVVTHGISGNPEAAGILASPTPQPELAVKAEVGWQSTGLALQPGQIFNVMYLDGTWTVDYRSVPYVGPEGYTGDWDEDLGRWCAVNRDFPYGRLLGRLGEGPAFSVGRGGEFAADRDGMLSFRINDGDGCLGDNAGQVRVIASAGIVELTSVTTTDERDRAQTTFRPGETLGLKIEARNTTGFSADVVLSWRVYDPYGRLLPTWGLENYATQAPPGDAWWGIAVRVPADALEGEYTYIGVLTSKHGTMNASAPFTVGERRLRVFAPFVRGK